MFCNYLYTIKQRKRNNEKQSFYGNLSGIFVSIHMFCPAGAFENSPVLQLGSLPTATRLHHTAQGRDPRSRTLGNVKHKIF